MKYLILLCLVSIIACKPASKSKVTEAIDNSQHETDEGENKYATRKLVHCVYFDLKSDISAEGRDSFMTVLLGFEQIQSVSELTVGERADSEDPRMPADFDGALQVIFESLEKLADYQKDSTHLAGKAILGPYLAGPPIVFDYWNSR